MPPFPPYFFQYLKKSGSSKFFPRSLPFYEKITLALLSVMDKEYSVHLPNNGSHDVSLLLTDHHIGFGGVRHLSHTSHRVQQQLRSGN
jgi:hypothetical protein